MLTLAGGEQRATSRPVRPIQAASRPERTARIRVEAPIVYETIGPLRKLRSGVALVVLLVVVGVVAAGMIGATVIVVDAALRHAASSSG